MRVTGRCHRKSTGDVSASQNVHNATTTPPTTNTIIPNCKCSTITGMQTKMLHAYTPLKQSQGWGPTSTPLGITVIPRGGVLQTSVMTRGALGITVCTKYKCFCYKSTVRPRHIMVEK